MSLATRCGTCGTMFRVVQDQLRVSEGWVRCGRCDAVFNALDALVDLDSDPLPVSERTPARAASAPVPAPAPERRVDPFLDAPADTPPLPEVDWDEPVGDTTDRPVDTAPAAQQAPSPAPADPRPAPSTAPPVREPLLAPAAAAPGGEPAAVAPGFVRRAERDARWQSPAMRAALLGCALMLLALLAVQAGYHFRDAIAARSPAAGQWLRSACARWDCRIEAPRRISEVTLEGSALSRLPQQSDAVKLSMSLRNRGSTALSLPSVELTLTDVQGQLIARRVLMPADLRIDPPVIAAGAELPVEVVLGTGDRAINGYTVELFYP